MTSFSLHTVDTAPEAGMATSPALLEGYMTLAGIFNKTRLTETERQIILMTSNRLNGCVYCMAAHSAISTGAGVPADVVAALRAGTPIADAKLEALRQFTIKIVESRGWPAAHDVQSLLAAGYTHQTVLDVILGTSLKVMSNYTNHVVQTPLDPAFAQHAWAAAV